MYELSPCQDRPQFHRSGRGRHGEVLLRCPRFHLSALRRRTARICARRVRRRFHHVQELSWREGDFFQSEGA